MTARFIGCIWAPAVAPRRESIPVLMAGIYPGAIKVAGRVADGLAMGALLSLSYVRERVRPVARDACADAGRDPDALRFMMAPMVAAHDDPNVARNAVRQAICSLYDP